MSEITMSGEATTLILGGAAIPDLVAGDAVILTPVNESTGRQNGANGAVTINRRVDADEYDIEIRVMKHSESDARLNNLEKQQVPVVLNGSVKTNLQRDGENVIDSWTIESASFTTKPTDTRNNTEGNVEMAYTIRARRAYRNI